MELLGGSYFGANYYNASGLLKYYIIFCISGACSDPWSGVELLLSELNPFHVFHLAIAGGDYTVTLL